MNWLLSEWRLFLPLLLGWLGILAMLPSHHSRARNAGLGLAAAALVLIGLYQLPLSGDQLRDTMFLVFAGAAIASGAMMITHRNPVYSALWFAVTTLSVCGLFLLNSAPFLAAATVIVYAGAIVVTFLFVIMLAQQEGATSYDQQAYQPAAATLAASLLLGCLLFTLQSWGRLSDVEQPNVTQKFVRPSAAFAANRLSQPTGDDLGSLRNVGRAMFTDYLYAVEIAGTVLLIATIGAIAIAPRRSQGTF